MMEPGQLCFQDARNSRARDTGVPPGSRAGSDAAHPSSKPGCPIPHSIWRVRGSPSRSTSTVALPLTNSCAPDDGGAAMMGRLASTGSTAPPRLNKAAHSLPQLLPAGGPGQPPSPATPAPHLCHRELQADALLGAEGDRPVLRDRDALKPAAESQRKIVPPCRRPRSPCA